MRHCSLGWYHSPALGSESRLPTAPRLPWAPVLSSPSQRLCLAHTPPHPYSASICYVILPHPVPTAPREISRVLPTYRKGSKALRRALPQTEHLFQAQLGHRCSSVDALGPFPDPHPKWMGCGHTTAEDHTGQPHMVVGAQTPGAPWEGGGLSARSQKHKASSWKLTPAGENYSGRKWLAFGSTRQRLD